MILLPFFTEVIYCKVSSIIKGAGFFYAGEVNNFRYAYQKCIFHSCEKTLDHLVWPHELSRPKVPFSCAIIELNSYIECGKLST